ncbi:MAG: lipopolysaccharide biosynthesis protein [Ginsengibacter sp.]
MSLRKTAVSGMMWTFGQQFGTQAIGFVVSIVLARILLPEEFGLIGMISVFIGIGTSLVNSGLTQSLIRTIEPDQEDYSTVFFFNLAGSIVIYWVLFLFAPLIAVFFSQPILTEIIRIYCLTFIISAFSEVQLTRLTKEMNFKLQMTIAIPSLIGSGLLGMFLAYKGYGVWSLVWMGIVQSFLNTLQLWIRTGWVPTFVFNMTKFRYHLKFGYKLTLSGLLDTVFTNIYQIIIGRLFLPAQVGFYTRADSLKQLPVSNISVALNKISYPLFASIQNDNVRLKKGYKQIMQMVVFLVAPVLVILGVLAEPLFRFLFTEKWLPAVPYFQILCVTGILYPLHSYNLNILNVKGRSDLFLKLEVVKKILIAIVILISVRFGILGLIWGQVIISVFAFFINTHFSGKFLNYNTWEQIKDIFPLIFLAFIAGAIVWSLDLEIQKSRDILRLLIGGAVGLLSYLGICAMLKVESLYELKRIILRKGDQ